MSLSHTPGIISTGLATPGALRVAAWNAPIWEPDMPLPPDASIAELADHLEQAVHDGGWGGPPVLLAVTDDDAPIAMPAPSNSGDLVTDLLGLRAPPDWQAVGVVVEGRAHPYDPDAAERYRFVRSDTPRRCRVAHVVDRSGGSAGVMRMEGSEPRSLGSGETSSGGRMVDACRRILGLPTAPPPEATHELWASMWLDRLVADAADPTRSGPVVSWEAAAVRHPAAEVVLEADPSLRRDVVRHLETLGRAMDGAKGWTHLRQECAAGRWAVPGLTPEAAGWMDDGMFARWTTSEFPPVGDLLGALRDLVPAGI